MGQVSSSALNQAETVAKDAVQLFQDVGAARHRAFRLRLQTPEMDTNVRRLIPVEEEMETTLYELVLVSDTAEVEPEVKEICSKYADEELFLPAISAVVSKDFFDLMNKPPGSAQVDNTLLTVGPVLGGLFRIDYLIYRYKPESMELNNQVGNMVFVIAVVHAVDSRKLQREQALHAVQAIYGEVADPGGKAKLLDIAATVERQQYNVNVDMSNTA